MRYPKPPVRVRDEGMNPRRFAVRASLMNVIPADFWGNGRCGRQWTSFAISNPLFVGSINLV